MKTWIIGLLAAAALFWGINAAGCSYRNVDNIKAAAPKVWADAGYEIVGYEGYQIGSPATPGGRVWYVVTRKGDKRILYTGFLSKWGDEYHIYNFRAYDAITPAP